RIHRYPEPCLAHGTQRTAHSPNEQHAARPEGNRTTRLCAVCCARKERSADMSVFVLGNCVVDIIGKPIDRLPKRGTLLLLDTLETHVGGNGPNAARALARLGTRVSMGGRVGDDLYGRFLIETLGQEGVDTRGVRRAPAATGVTLVAVDSTGERSFI